MGQKQPVGWCKQVEQHSGTDLLHEKSDPETDWVFLPWSI